MMIDQLIINNFHRDDIKKRLFYKMAERLIISFYPSGKAIGKGFKDF